MKAIMYADWLNMKQLLKTMLLFLFFFTFVAFVSGEPQFFSTVLVMMSLIVPLSLCSMDRAYGWDKMSLSMPILRQDVVGSKFLVSGLTNAAMFAIMSVLTVGYCLYADTSEPLDECMMGLVACETIALVMMGVAMVLRYKWGEEKARFILVACVWVPILGALLLKNLGIPKPDLSFLEALNDIPSAVIAGAALAVGLLVYAACYMISVQIYKKAEM